MSLCVSPHLSPRLLRLFSATLPISVSTPLSSRLFLSLSAVVAFNHLHLLWWLLFPCRGVPLHPDQAIRLRVHPLYLMIPGTVGCSYAFMLPVSTPPNSIAFASGHLLVKDMVSRGSS